MDNEKWQLEGLIKRAFERTKQKFVSYFLTWVVSFGMGIAVLIIFGLGIGLVAILYAISKSVLIGVLVGAILAIAGYVGLIFVSSWISLATTSVLISDENLGAVETFKKVRPMVWGYFWMNVASSLFFLGLIPWGILSLGVIFVLWGLWATFQTFVYLKFQKKGLQNLWISRQMFRQNPWGIWGRMSLIFIASWAISILINLIFGNFGKSGNFASSGISMLFSIFLTPFTLCFNYEMFLNLEEPKEEVKKPSMWFALSIIGFVIMIIVFVVIAILGFLQIGSMQQKALEMKNLQDLKRIEMQKEIDNIERFPIGSFSGIQTR